MYPPPPILSTYHQSRSLPPPLQLHPTPHLPLLSPSPHSRNVFPRHLRFLPRSYQPVVLPRVPASANWTPGSIEHSSCGYCKSNNGAPNPPLPDTHPRSDVVTAAVNIYAERRPETSNINCGFSFAQLARSSYPSSPCLSSITNVSSTAAGDGLSPRPQNIISNIDISKEWEYPV